MKKITLIVILLLAGFAASLVSVNAQDCVVTEINNKVLVSVNVSHMQQNCNENLSYTAQFNGTRVSNVSGTIGTSFVQYELVWCYAKTPLEIGEIIYANVNGEVIFNNQTLSTNNTFDAQTTTVCLHRLPDNAQSQIDNEGTSIPQEISTIGNVTLSSVELSQHCDINNELGLSSDEISNLVFEVNEVPIGFNIESLLNDQGNIEFSFPDAAAATLIPVNIMLNDEIIGQVTLLDEASILLRLENYDGNDHFPHCITEWNQD